MAAALFWRSVCGALLVWPHKLLWLFIKNGQALGGWACWPQLAALLLFVPEQMALPMGIAPAKMVKQHCMRAFVRPNKI
jgi:hypothetical protein